MNNALLKHSWEKDHRIDWNGAKIIFKSNEIGVRRVIEGAAINMGTSMEGNKSFTQEDPAINNFICKTYLKSFVFKNDPLCTVPDAAVASSSLAQVTGDVPDAPPVTGAHSPEVGLPQIQPPTRRSRRLAGLPNENDGIT